MAERRPWHRQTGETKKAFDAFGHYYRLSPRERSIDEAYRRATNRQGTSNHAPGQWTKWSSKHKWVERALAHDEHIAEQDRLLWEERRRELQRRDWEQADALRDVIERAIPHAEQFIQRRTHRVGAETIITLSFDIDALARVLVQASKLQRLTVDAPTDNLNLTGAALDAYIDRRLADMAYGTEAGPGAPVEPDGAQADGGTEPDAGALPG